MGSSNKRRTSSIRDWTYTILVYINSQLNHSPTFDYLQTTLLCIWLRLTKPMLPSYKKISNFLKNGKIDHRCFSTRTRVTVQDPTLIHDYILHNQIIKEKDAVKYLGVTVHHKLSLNEHICSIVKKANSSIRFLRRNSPETHQS